MQKMSMGDKFEVSQDYLNNIPEEMKERKQWLCYKVSSKKLESGEWQYSKLPYSPLAESSKGWNKQENWCSFNEAIDAFSKNEELMGLSFVVTKDDPYVAIDIDHCIENRQLSETAKEIVEATKGTYTELSRSRKGLHIFCKAEIAKNFNLNSVEMYNDNKPIALTGLSYSKYFEHSKTVEERDISALYEKYAPKQKATYIPKTYTDVSIGDLPSDTQILETMQKYNPRGWEIFQYGGKTGNGSRDDFSLMVHLNSFCHGDTSTMVRLFKQSACVRPIGEKRNTEEEYDKYLYETAKKATQKSSGNYWDYSYKQRKLQEFHFSDKVSRSEIDDYYKTKTYRQATQELPANESILGRMVRSKPESAELYFGKAEGNARMNDWKLIKELAYYCAGDEKKIKEIFCGSRLYKQHEGEYMQKQYDYYLDKTIEKIANRQERVHDWHKVYDKNLSKKPKTSELDVERER